MTGQSAIPDIQTTHLKYKIKQRFYKSLNSLELPSNFGIRLPSVEIIWKIEVRLYEYWQYLGI